jgi:hypothetical protein
MLRLLLICCFLTLPCYPQQGEFEELILSTPDQLSTLMSEPDMLIGGLVSPLSGQLALREIDLIAKGAAGIALTRSYVPPFMPSSFSQDKEIDKRYLHSHLMNLLGKMIRAISKSFTKKKSLKSMRLTAQRVFITKPPPFPIFFSEKFSLPERF